MKIAKIFAAIAIVMMISGSAFAHNHSTGSEKSIQGRHGMPTGGGNDWGKGVSETAKENKGLGLPDNHPPSDE